eukprot:11162147-Lingulodinium_polyedra.AAC.1
MAVTGPLVTGGSDRAAEGKPPPAPLFPKHVRRRASYPSFSASTPSPETCKHDPHNLERPAPDNSD